MNYIHPTALIADNVTMGTGNYIGPYCVIGFPPEHADHFPNSPFGVIIGNGNKITGGTTIDAGTVGHTTVWDNNFIMKGCHIGHDCIIYNYTKMSPHVILGGHTIVHNHVNLGMGSIVHQWQTIPAGCMIGMGAIVCKNLEMQPFDTIFGNPARVIGKNTYLINKLKCE